MTLSITRTFTAEDARKAKRLKRVWEAKKKEINLTQVQIAEKLDITQGMFSQMLNGHVAIPKFLLLRISKILKVPAEEIDPEIREALTPEFDLEGSVEVTYPVMFTTTGDKPSTGKHTAMKRNKVSHGYAVEVTNEDYAPFIKIGSVIIIDPLTSIDKDDNVFVRTIDNKSFLARFVCEDNGVAYFGELTGEESNMNLPVDSILAIHYIDSIELPQK